MSETDRSAAGSSAGARADLAPLANSDPAAQRVLDQIEIWRKELINLARSNRLLYFRHTQSSTLEIVREPDQVDEVVARLLANGAWRFFMPPDQAGEAENDDQVDIVEDGHGLVNNLPAVPSPDELITSKADARSLRRVP